ncbi:MAG: type II toxin-antitoxin system VapC family toxin [Syntrophobacteraceae bacterium]|jgi:PIN domain nuclease of toxin-antitoxin system
MKVLLDTHCWLLWLTEPEKLKEDARKILENGSNIVFLSAASSREIAIKYSLGRLNLPEPPERFVPKRLMRDGITPLPVQHTHAPRVAELPYHHRDPFDRLIISQSMVEGFPVMTVDRRFESYELQVIWA